MITDPCIYCSAPYPSFDHTDGCPLATSVYTYFDDDWVHGLVCMDCKHVFVAGDSYYSFESDDEAPEGKWHELICLGCAAFRAFS